jgi:predicted ATP-dependent endonuclease of OLD family
LILIDEPGSFLHPKAQHDILDMLEKRVVSDGNIVMYSTHSPYLLPADRLDRVRIAFKDEDNRTVIADRINDERLRGALRGDALAPIWNAIGIEISESGPGPLANRTELVVVEGITDYYYLHAWCKLIGHELLSSRKILISNGTPLMGYSVSLAIAYSNNFVLLLDRDEAGNAASEKLVREMNINPSSIVRPRDAAGIEDLFTANDFAALIVAGGLATKGETQHRPTIQIRRLKIDKVIVARHFAESVRTGSVTAANLDEASIAAARTLLDSLAAAFQADPIVSFR